MKLLALVALIPVAIGPLPSEQRVLNVGLCIGDKVITIPLDDEPSKEEHPCSSAGCHAGASREKSKGPKQLT